MEVIYGKGWKGKSVKVARGALSDPLTRRLHNAYMLRTLGTLARRLLCVPATLAPSEHIFSVSIRMSHL